MDRPDAEHAGNHFEWDSFSKLYDLRHEDFAGNFPQTILIVSGLASASFSPSAVSNFFLGSRSAPLSPSWRFACCFVGSRFTRAWSSRSFWLFAP